MKKGFKKRTSVDTRKQLADLGQITPRSFEVNGDHSVGFEVFSKGLFTVPCKTRGETYAILETMKELFLHHDVMSKYLASSVGKAKKTEIESEEAAHKLCEYINRNKACMGLSAVPYNNGGFKVELVRGSNAKILATFSSWYKCMIYLRGMCEMVVVPVTNF